MADQFLAVMGQIDTTCREPGPFLYAISSSGSPHPPLTAVSDGDKNKDRAASQFADAVSAGGSASPIRVGRGLARA